MPLTTNNPTDPARDGSDEDWARWEQTFRDARPVLPEAAMARIEATLRREGGEEGKTSRLRWRILLLVGALIVVNAVAFLVFRHHSQSQPDNGGAVEPAISNGVVDRYPLTAALGPVLAAPERPIVPLAENLKWISGDGPIAPAEPTTRPISTFASNRLKGAERLVDVPRDGWHALGLMEMRRAEHLSSALVQVGPPRQYEYRCDYFWRKLEEPGVDAFRDPSAFTALLYSDADSGKFWIDTLELVRASERNEKPAELWKFGFPHPSSRFAFPSKAGDWARFDLLVELGMPKAQAALEVLTTRSYGPLKRLRGLDESQLYHDLPARFHQGLLTASRDCVERIFALQLLGFSKDAADLIQKAGNLPYLLNPPDLEVLLVRLGPVDAWEKLLRPLMEDEVAFIEHPPRFDEFSPRHEDEVVVQAARNSKQSGEVTYHQAALTAGPWHINCEKLIAVRASSRVTVFTGSGSVQVHGVIGLLSATADSMTFNTETGELKLTGNVLLEEWTGNRDVKACTIVGTGEIRIDD